MYNHTINPNFHVLKVSFIGPTNYKGSRVKITSERFKVARIVDYDHRYDTTLDIAENWLTNHGFTIVGHGESKDGYYVITSTFEPLPKH